MSKTKKSSKDATSYTTPGITTESSRPHFTQFQQKSHKITSESSDYSTVIIVVTAIVIFVLAIVIAIFITLMQRKKHKKKLRLAAELEKEEQERKRRRSRKVTPKRTPRKKRGKSTPKSRKFYRPRTKEEMMMELSDFLEAHSKKFKTPEELVVGSAEPSPVPTPTVTPGLLSSEVDVSFKSPAAADSRLQKISSEDAEYPQKSKQPFTPEVDEKEAVDRTPSIEVSEKSEKKSAGTSSVPAAPNSSNIASASHTKAVTTGSKQATPTDSRQATPTAIEHEGLNESRSQEQESWDLESAEKEGYPDKSMEQWEEILQKAEKAEKEDEGSHETQEKVGSKGPPE